MVLLDWKLNPIPTKYGVNDDKPTVISPSVLPNIKMNIKPSRKPPKIRNLQEDEMPIFRNQDIISDFNELNTSKFHAGFTFKHLGDAVVYFNLSFEQQHGEHDLKSKSSFAFLRHYKSETKLRKLCIYYVL